MAGRGRGANKTFNYEQLGFGRGGDALPVGSVQPPPLYPPLERHPLPLECGEKYEYLLELKREFCTSMEDSPYYIKAEEKRADIARYSDKYKNSQSGSDALQIDWSKLPVELRPKIKKVKKEKLPTKNAKKKVDEKMLKAIEDLEKKDTENGAESAEGSDEEEEKDEDEEQEDEEKDLEEDDVEENDYVTEHFDNGEDFGNDDDDNMDDGAIY